jgi:hypothetical protein
MTGGERKRASPSSLFFSFIIDQIFDGFRKDKIILKKNGRWFRFCLFRFFQKIWNKMTFSIAGVVTFSGGNFGPNNYQRLCFKIFEMFRCSENDIKNIVLIFDEVNSMEDGAELCFSFVRGLQEFYDDVFFKNPEKEITKKLINICVIVLPLPGWKSKIGEFIRIRMTLDNFTVFDKIQLKEYLDEQMHAFGWQYEQSFFDSLYALSGGIPPLFQKIGVQSCEICERDDPNSKKLTFEILNRAIQSNSVKTKVENIAINLGLKSSVFFDDDKLKEIASYFYTCSPVDILQPGFHSEEVISGFPKSKWQSKILGIITANQNNKILFDKIWGLFVTNGIIVQNVLEEGKYHFCSELIRRTIK